MIKEQIRSINLPYELGYWVTDSTRGKVARDVKEVVSSQSSLLTDPETQGTMLRTLLRGTGFKVDAWTDHTKPKLRRLYLRSHKSLDDFGGLNAYVEFNDKGDRFESPFDGVVLCTFYNKKGMSLEDKKTLSFKWRAKLTPLLVEADSERVFNPKRYSL